MDLERKEEAGRLRVRMQLRTKRRIWVGSVDKSCWVGGQQLGRNGSAADQDAAQGLKDGSGLGPYINQVGPMVNNLGRSGSGRGQPYIRRVLREHGLCVAL